MYIFLTQFLFGLSVSFCLSLSLCLTCLLNLSLSHSAWQCPTVQHTFRKGVWIY